MSSIEISKDTKANIPLVLLVTVLIFFVSSGAYMGKVVTDFEAQDNRLEQLILTESCSRKDADENIKKDLNEIKPAVIEIKTKLAGIETNIEWLVNERRNDQ